MKYKDTVILVFAKAPVAGAVNTRLIAETGVEKATQLQNDLIHHRLEELSQARLCETYLMCAPDAEHPCFQQCLSRYDIKLLVQEGDCLGERISRAVKSAADQWQSIIVIGTDAPSLTVALIESSIRALKNKHQIAIAPAEDGGYVMIGMAGYYPELFKDIAWGTDRVYEQTLQIAAALKLDCYITPVCWDIDRPEDYYRYLAQFR